MNTNDYEKQATDFLEKTGTTLTVRCIKYGKHFRNDRYAHFVYEFTLERHGRKYTSIFGDSIAHAFKTIIGQEMTCTRGISIHEDEILKSIRIDTTKQIFSVKKGYGEFSRVTKPIPLPSAYSILSCLEKYEPSESVDDFAAEYGYEVGKDTKIKDIIETHNACIEQYKGLCMLFNESEMDELREIN